MASKLSFGLNYYTSTLDEHPWLESIEKQIKLEFVEGPEPLVILKVLLDDFNMWPKSKPIISTDIKQTLYPTVAIMLGNLGYNQNDQ